MRVNAPTAFAGAAAAALSTTSSVHAFFAPSPGASFELCKSLHHARALSIERPSSRANSRTAKMLFSAVEPKRPRRQVRPPLDSWSNTGGLAGIRKRHRGSRLTSRAGRDDEIQYQGDQREEEDDDEEYDYEDGEEIYEDTLDRCNRRSGHRFLS